MTYDLAVKNKPDGAILVVKDDEYYYRFPTGPDVRASDMATEPLGALERYLNTENPSMATAAEIARREQKSPSAATTVKELFGQLSNTLTPPQVTTNPAISDPEIYMPRNPQEVIANFKYEHPELDLGDYSGLTGEQLAALYYYGAIDPFDNTSASNEVNYGIYTGGAGEVALSGIGGTGGSGGSTGGGGTPSVGRMSGTSQSDYLYSKQKGYIGLISWRI